MSSNDRLRPLCIQVHAQDNVAIVANEGGLPAGTQFDFGLTLLETIPEAHKVALCDIAPGAPIVRYGVIDRICRQRRFKKADGCMKG